MAEAPPAGGLTELIARLGEETEAAMAALFARRKADEITEEQFLELAARLVMSANQRATGAADLAVAAQLTAQDGAAVPPVGLRIPDTEHARLLKALHNTRFGSPEVPTEIREMRLKRLARSEPKSAAQDGAQEAGKRQGAKGWKRQLDADACELCQKWADGKVRPMTVKMIRHPGCGCTPKVMSGRKTSEKERPGKGALAGAAALMVFNPLTPGPTWLLAHPAVRADVVRRYNRARLNIFELGGAQEALRAYMTGVPAEGPTIFERMAQLERILRYGGVEFEEGSYAIHGSGLLDALNLRRAADIDVIVTREKFEQIATTRGWKRVTVGINKDREAIVPDPKVHPRLHTQIVPAYESTPSERFQLTRADLTGPNTTTIGGKRFIAPDALVKMKTEAIREGAKVAKNQRDIDLLAGRLRWDEDVRRFGRLVNQSASGQRADQMLRERAAVGRYGKGSFVLNRKLRGLKHGAKLTPAEANQVELIDRAIAARRTPARVQVYRGLRMSQADALRKYGQVGTVVTDEAFLSTGLREKVARKYAQSGVTMEIEVPEGMPGYFAPYRAYAPQSTHAKILDTFGEDELLLPRNTPVYIDEVVDHGDGTVTIRARAVPPASARIPPSPRAGNLYNMLPAGFPSGEVVADVAFARQAAAILRDMFPNMDVDLVGMSGRNLAGTIDGVVTMGERYPQLLDVIRRMAVSPDIPDYEGIPGHTMRPPEPWDEGGVAISGPIGPMTWVRRLLFNPRFAGDDNHLRALLSANPNQFALRNMEDVVIHELGHHVHFRWMDLVFETHAAQLRATGVPIWPDPADPDALKFKYEWSRVREAIDSVLNGVVEEVTGYSFDDIPGKLAIYEDLSEYALDNTDEMLAEAFAQVIQGRYRRTGNIFELDPDGPSPLALALVDAVERSLHAGRLGAGWDIEVVRPPGGALPPLGDVFVRAGAEVTQAATKAAIRVGTEVRELLGTVAEGVEWAADVTRLSFGQMRDRLSELVASGVDLGRELGNVERFIANRFGPDFTDNLPGAYAQALLKTMPKARRLDFVTRLIESGIDPSADADQLMRFLKANPSFVRYLPDAVKAVRPAVEAAAGPASSIPGQAALQAVFGDDVMEKAIAALFDRLKGDPERLLELFDDVTGGKSFETILRKYHSDLGSTVATLAKDRLGEVSGAVAEKVRRTLRRTTDGLRDAADRPPPPRISPTEPNADKAFWKGEEPPAGKRPRRAGEGPAQGRHLISDRAVPDTIARQATVPGFEDLAGRTDRAALDEIVNRQARNIIAAAERARAINPDAVKAHAEWYPFANRWVGELAESKGVSREGALAATAALSPGTDWADNVAWAKKMIEAIADDVVVQADWIDARLFDELERSKGLGTVRYRRELIGKRLSEIDDEDAAYAIRGWHDMDNVMQIGGRPGFGRPEDKTRPQSLDNLTKAVSAIRDPSVENLDRVLGGQKVRSFFNNLVAPLDAEWAEVTIDTHHFGVANGHPWTTSSKWIDTKKGSINLTDTPSSGDAGVGGTYPLVVDATRKATEEINRAWGTTYTPNQVQSIVWELWRAEYPDTSRRGPRFATMTRDIERARTARAKGLITDAEERDLVEAARIRGGGMTPAELTEAYAADAAGQPRRPLSEMRKEQQRRVKKGLRIMRGRSRG